MTPFQTGLAIGTLLGFFAFPVVLCVAACLCAAVRRQWP